MTTLTIQVNDVPSAPPPSLEARLRRKNAEPKSPEALAADLAAQAKRVAALREAHIEAVKDRAARESQRVAEALKRKLRLAVSKADKVQRHMDAADAKTKAKKEAAAAEREARKTRREEMALAVAQARADASCTRDARQRALAEMEALAFVKHSKSVATVAQKATWVVRHAAEVVAARKEKEQLDARAAADRLSARLHKAEVLRTVSAPPAEISPVLHRVLNDEKVKSETLRKVHEATMAKASLKREQALQTVAQKASLKNERAAAIASKAHAKNSGTDSESIEAKVALYSRLLRADVARNVAVKSRVPSRQKSDTILAIVVKLDHLKPRMPPPVLSLRLSVVNRSLLATATARHIGAAARRMTIRQSMASKAAEDTMRRAAALARIGKAHAAIEAKMKASAARAMINCAIAQGKRLHGVSRAIERQFAAKHSLAELAARQKAAGAAAQARCDGAFENRSRMLCRIAKKGVVAVRLAAFNSRREALRKAALSQAASKMLREKSATSKREMYLKERVVLAQKCIKAMHPKREVADLDE